MKELLWWNHNETDQLVELGPAKTGIEQRELAELELIELLTLLHRVIKLSMIHLLVTQFPQYYH